MPLRKAFKIMQGGVLLSILSKENLDHIKINYNPSDLVDIHGMTFKDGTAEEILTDFITKVKNPYHFKSGNVEIEVIYNDSSNKIVSDLLKDYFLKDR